MLEDVTWKIAKEAKPPAGKLNLFFLDESMTQQGALGGHPKTAF